jgi:hypothetical protein
MMPVDRPALAGAVEDEVKILLTDRVFLGNIHQQMGVLDGSPSPSERGGARSAER